MKLSDIVQKQGIEKTEQKPKASDSSAPRRRYFWDEEENQQEASMEALKAKSPVVAIKAHKLEPIISQSEVKVEPLLEPKIVQSLAKVEPNQSRQTTVKMKVEPKPEPNDEPKLSQSSAKVKPNVFFEELVGLQRNVLIHVFEMCMRTGSRTTPPVAISNLAIALETTVSAGRKAIQRLEEKGFIIRGNFKDGRGGWTKYELKEEVYKTLLLDHRTAKLESNVSQSRVKVDTQLEPKPEPNPPYSSSNDLNINTNTIGLPDNLRRFGISVVNLQNLVTSGKTTQDVVERSLAALSFDVGNGKTGSLANILFGVLNSGREYISQKYSETLQTEIDQELVRIAEAEENQKRVIEVRLRMKFQEHIQANPQFLDSVKEQHKGYVKNQELLDKLAFEEFKNIEASI